MTDRLNGKTNFVNGFNHFAFADGQTLSRTDFIAKIGEQTDAKQAQNTAEFIGSTPSDVLTDILNAGSKGKSYIAVDLRFERDGQPTQSTQRKLANLVVELSSRLGYEVMGSISNPQNGEPTVQIFTSKSYDSVNSELLWDTVFAIHTHPPGASNEPSGFSGDLAASEDYEAQMQAHTGSSHELIEHVINWNTEVGQSAGAFGSAY